MLKIIDIKYTNSPYSKLIHEDLLQEVYAKKVCDEVHVIAKIKNDDVILNYDSPVIAIYAWDEDEFLDSDSKMTMIKKAYKAMKVEV